MITTLAFPFYLTLCIPISLKGEGEVVREEGLRPS